MRAFGGIFLPTICVVTIIAHSFGVMLSIHMGTPQNLTGEVCSVCPQDHWFSYGVLITNEVKVYNMRVSYHPRLYSIILMKMGLNLEQRLGAEHRQADDF